MRENEINMRRGTAEQWRGINPVLEAGEPGFETDTKKFKVGDGTTAWNGLRYAGFDGGDLDTRVIDPLGSHTYGGTTIVLANYFVDAPVYAIKGVTGSTISVPVGFSRAVYIDASGNVTQEDVTPGQVLTFKSEILLGATDYPCEDEGLAPGKCIEKYRIDRSARFPQKFQPCPSVCRDDTGKDCNCSSSSSSSNKVWFCDENGGCREVPAGSDGSFKSAEDCAQACCLRTDGSYQTGRNSGCDPNCNTKEAICANAACSGAVNGYYCQNCIDYSQPTIPWGIACKCDLAPKNGCDCLDAGFGNGSDCMGAWCVGADQCLCESGSYLTYKGTPGAGVFVRGGNCGIALMGLSDEEGFGALSMCKGCGYCKKCNGSGSCIDDPACSSSSSPYTPMLRSGHVTIEW
jgi:hypothetical protein